jgi:uncharacterized protein YqjF (DUF2071 family)
MHPALEEVAHRPWHLPRGPWVMAQRWHDLLFAHWSVAPQALRPLVPPALALDLRDGRAWVGVVPFWMSGVRARGLPALPGASTFPELNVRTYVTFDGKPGVFFFSLDAANWMAVQAARALYHLPYFYARMSARREGEDVLYGSVRRQEPAEFRGRYRPVSEVQRREPGSMEHWLTERYCLYTVHRGSVYAGEIHHAPWPLQDSAAEIEVNTVAAAAGILLPQSKPVLHFARRLDVLIWGIRRVGCVGRIPASGIES